MYTVISGIFYIGVGDQFDTDKLHSYPPGAVIILPGSSSHFHWAKSGDCITQVTAIGPLGLEYLNRRRSVECPLRDVKFRYSDEG